MAHTHPESLDEIKSVEITDDITQFVQDLSSLVEEDRVDRGLWEVKIDKHRKLRYGIRNKKNFPWPNAANFSIPLIDADINRLKPSYVNLAYSVSPVVTFEPFGGEDIEAGKKRERLFDWRLRTKVKFFMPYTLGIDRMLDQGQVIFKIRWKYATRNYFESFDIAELDEETQRAIYDARVDDDMLFNIIQEEFRVDLDHEENEEAIRNAVQDFRDGKSKLEIQFIETVDDRPEVIVCDLREDLVIPIDTLNINDARRIDYIFPITINDLKIAIEDGQYVESPDADIDSWAGKAATRTGKASDKTPEEIVWLHETCVWKDIDGDGIEERCITTWPDSSPKSVLRFIEQPYDHGMWPYVQVRRELNDAKFYSPRGIGDLDAEFQKGISTFLNQAVDNGTIVNTPQVVVRQNALVNKRNLRYVPGNVIELKGALNEYELRQSTNVSQGHQLQLAQFLKNWGDQRNGNQTSGISDNTNLIGQGDKGKKTAREIDLISGLQGQIQSLDLQVFQQQMAMVYFQIDALYEQFGDETETILITGQAPEQISRREIQGKFNIIPNGRLDNSTPGARLQKAVIAKQLLAESPFVKHKELDKQIAKEIDDRLASLIMMTDEEIQQQQEIALKQQIAAEEQRKKDITDSLQIKMAFDNTDIRKEALLVPIQGKKFAPN